MAAMNRLGALAAIAAAACGGDNEEPIAGDVAIGYGDETITPTVGAALDSGDGDPNKALVVIGTRGVSCETTNASNLRKGTYLTFTIDRVVGSQSPFVSVIRIDSGSAHLNGSAGQVTIDAIEDRVTGSVVVDTSDAEIGAISAAGTFDVVRCF